MSVRADHVIAAVGFSTEERLIRDLSFPSGKLSQVFETSIPGVCT